MKRNVDNLRCQLQDTMFTGRESIAIISFLTAFYDTSDELKLSEHEAYMALSRFIEGDTLVQFRTAVKTKP